MMPLHVGDVVQSPMGPFLIKHFSSAAVNPTHPLPSDKREMCSGELIGWQLADNRFAQATFWRNSLTIDTKVDVYCFDCEIATLSPFHFYGIECQQCHGFNTSKD